MPDEFWQMTGAWRRRTRESPLNRRALLILSLLIVGSGVSGCGFGYYAQAVRGEFQILTHRQSIEKLIANPNTPAKLKQQLQFVQQLRAFARTELELRVDGSYGKYVDVHRKYVVWTVQAA